ncbi:MAG: methyltransferase domain-containing protein [Anaerolineae bacterium]|nr:methyltransferase domain-containing protein [Anaerolineae bacterium]MCO5192332.1 methyltransferase domain-containing protein [Anaerolineae bacterium]MCO5203811.1 methyltransferase domain-containing protein [Anaerolineae bacterium]
MSEYLLAGDDELTRLQLQARVWAESAETLFDHIGILPGWSAVDLGCGAMGVLGPLLQRVGTDGYVVGVDGDAYLLQAAAAYLLREGLEAVDLRHGDATQTMLDAASFDVVHARFLFPHIPQPQTLLDEMMRLARPGGIIIAQEPDHSSWHFYPRCPEWPELLDILERALALRGDINIGRRIYGIFRDAGLNDLRVRAAVVALQNGHPYMRMPVMAAQAMRERIVAAGLVTAARLDALVAAVERAALADDTLQITFTTVQVWGRTAGGGAGDDAR